MVESMGSSKKLTRTREGKIVCGVAQGIANYLGVDVLWVRFAFIGLFLLHGSGLLIYFLLCLLLPMEVPYYYTQAGGFQTPTNTSESNSSSPNAHVPRTERPSQPPTQSDSSMWVMGVMLIALGFLFLADNVFPDFRFSLYWPWLLVAIGVGILLSIYFNNTQSHDES